MGFPPLLFLQDMPNICKYSSAYLEYFIKSIMSVHYFLFFWIQNGTAYQKVKILAREACPHHLTKKKIKFKKNNPESVAQVYKPGAIKSKLSIQHLGQK